MQTVKKGISYYFKRNFLLAKVQIRGYMLPSHFLIFGAGLSMLLKWKKRSRCCKGRAKSFTMKNAANL
jgi:hypothetical protein